MAKTIDVKHDTTGLLSKSSRYKLSAIDIYLNHTKTDRKLRSIIDKNLKSHDVSLMHWLLIGVLIKSSDGLLMNQISDELGISLPGATALVNQLKDRHLIVQKTDRHDRRQKLVVPTAKGRALFRLIKPKLESEVRSVFEPIPANYLVFYRRVIKAIWSTD